MFGRNLILIASLVFPIIAAPVAVNELTSRDDVIIERRGPVSLLHGLRDVIERHPLIEPLHVRLSSDIATDARLDRSIDSRDSESSTDDVEKRQYRPKGSGNNNGRSIEERQYRPKGSGNNNGRSIEERQYRPKGSGNNNGRSIEERQYRPKGSGNNNGRSVEERQYRPKGSGNNGGK